MLRSSFRSFLGFGYKHPLSRSDRETGEGVARAVGMHALGTYADVRAEILSLKHRGPSSSPQEFLLILFPGSSLLVAVLELAACIHGCDLKHSGWPQLEGTPLNLLLDTASPLTVPTIRGRAVAAFPTTASCERFSSHRVAIAIREHCSSSARGSKQRLSCICSVQPTGRASASAR